MTSHPASRTADGLEHAPRQPVRLELSPSPGRSPVDGGWWPRTRDLDVELADLIDSLPGGLGTMCGAHYSRPDWNTRPRTVATFRSRIQTGYFPRDDTHLLLLSTSTGTTIRLLVVPPEHPSGQRALDRAAHPANRLTATQLLFTSVEPEDQDDLSTDQSDQPDQWNDTGGNWWQGTRAPSFRRATAPPAPVLNT